MAAESLLQKARTLIDGAAPGMTALGSWSSIRDSLPRWRVGGPRFVCIHSRGEQAAVSEIMASCAVDPASNARLLPDTLSLFSIWERVHGAEFEVSERKAKGASDANLLRPFQEQRELSVRFQEDWNRWYQDRRFLAVVGSLGRVGELIDRFGGAFLDVKRFENGTGLKAIVPAWIELERYEDLRLWLEFAVHRLREEVEQIRAEKIFGRLGKTFEMKAQVVATQKMGEFKEFRERRRLLLAALETREFLRAVEEAFQEGLKKEPILDGDFEEAGDRYGLSESCARRLHRSVIGAIHAGFPDRLEYDPDRILRSFEVEGFEGRFRFSSEQTAAARQAFDFGTVNLLSESIEEWERFREQLVRQGWRISAVDTLLRSGATVAISIFASMVTRKGDAGGAGAVLVLTVVSLLVNFGFNLIRQKVEYKKKRKDAQERIREKVGTLPERILAAYQKEWQKLSKQGMDAVLAVLKSRQDRIGRALDRRNAELKADEPLSDQRIRLVEGVIRELEQIRGTLAQEMATIADPVREGGEHG